MIKQSQKAIMNKKAIFLLLAISALLIISCSVNDENGKTKDTYQRQLQHSQQKNTDYSLHRKQKKTDHSQYYFREKSGAHFLYEWCLTNRPLATKSPLATKIHRLFATQNSQTTRSTKKQTRQLAKKKTDYSQQNPISRRFGFIAPKKKTLFSPPY